MTNDEDRCGSGEDDHEVLVKIEFDVSEGDTNLGTVHSHIHNVSPEVAAQSLVIAAHRILSDYMAHTAFESCADHHMAHAMADGAASAALAEVARNVPTSADITAVAIPDDISSLIEGE